MDVSQKLKEIIASLCVGDVTPESILEGSVLNLDYGMDSITLVNLIVELEDAFGIEFSDDDFGNQDLFQFNTLNHIVEQKIEKKS